MKSGIWLLISVILAVVIYIPAMNLRQIRTYVKDFNRQMGLVKQGVDVGGPADSYEVKLADFYGEMPEQKNRFTARLWHERDSLFVIMDGVDAAPQMRKMLAKSFDDSVNPVPYDDRIKVSVDFDHDRVHHINYQYSFSGAALSAGNEGGQFVPGSRINCPVPWTLKIDGAAWHFRTAIPLNGRRVIGFNLGRKYNGAGDHVWSFGNDPARFVTLNLK